MHEGDRVCEYDFAKWMLAEQINDSKDIQVLYEHYSLEEDINHQSLNSYRNRLSAYKPDHPFLDLEPFEFFKKIGGWRKDRESGKSGITVAGLLMFG